MPITRNKLKCNTYDCFNRCHGFTQGILFIAARGHQCPNYQYGWLNRNSEMSSSSTKCKTEQDLRKRKQPTKNTIYRLLGASNGRDFLSCTFLRDFLLFFVFSESDCVFRFFFLVSWQEWSLIIGDFFSKTFFFFSGRLLMMIVILLIVLQKRPQKSNSHQVL